ncbi:MAG: hypothetical protein GFH27_549331n35 [Chloroflexi bacterium AL-W]|nr:hypothetical protein [Chloroflexi bacterium AL-N1]NOK70336.1 hypothetical protein [Chloroflexi bacterium AL-N10]NOK78014.1 hypothetical protein [Chloroflexi bacterium AL-N5]NOK85113.1 hypothetical protein [Chloroflexi bacterium AL-W]NOK92102.1 hypothetical protein [Chloroflexi bacterium AL-N15]
MTNKTTKRWLWWTFGVLGLGFFACVLLAGFGARQLSQMDFGEDSIFGGPTEDVTPAQIESIARITLPPSADDLHAQLQGFQDNLIHVRFTMNADELPQFLASSRCPSLTPATDIPFQESITPDTTWWTPETAQTFETCNDFVDGIGQTIMVDMTESQSYQVYVVTMET